jgi:putative Holliday junction resolvase
MGRVMAIDFGTRRVGIALSDVLRLTAHGFETVSWNGKDVRFVLDRISTIIVEKDVTEVVIGLPRRTDGAASESQNMAQAFGLDLASLTGIEPFYQDERYTTVIASRYLRETNVSGRSKKNVVDQVAAEIILREYLESRRVEK